MNIALWVAQIVLAALFLAAGGFKLLRPRAELQAKLPYTQDFTDAHNKAIGALEVLGAIGLVLPWLTGIAPWLTPLAALGLAITMVGAIRVHARRHEPVIMNIVLLALALFVALGRSLAWQ